MAAAPASLFVLPPGLTAAEGALDLLGIPAAMLMLQGGAVRTEFANADFRRLADECAELAPELFARVERFLSGRGSREHFGWSHGHAVDPRHQRVTFARVRTRTEPVCLVSLVEVTAEVRGREDLRREMTNDSLTGLPNRAGFGDAIEATTASDPTGYAVLMVDLERFSRINACLGAMAGDELLMTVARRLRGTLRARDVLARTGGDEFGILLAIERDDEAERAAERVAHALSTPFRLSGYDIRMTCAVGIAYARDPALATDDVLRHAQFAMKRAKRTGHIETYHAVAMDEARQTFSIETRLRRAIEKGELQLFFQPICDLATGRITAFETLTRWRDETGAVLSPDRFIPVAEDTGLILPLGRWAIEESLRTLAGWDARRRGHCGVAMAVNVSALQLQRDHLLPVVERALAANGLGGARLKLEITESALIAEPERIAGVLHELKALGIAIALDDFGTGYSNLAYLQRLPIDQLKIDRGFVTGLLGDRDKVAIVRAILSLAQALGMTTVAEGIETTELGQTLAALGCACGQGYTFSRPLDAEGAYALLCERNS